MKIAFLKPGKIATPANHVYALLDYLKEKGAEVREYDLKERDVNEIVKEIEEWKPLFLMDVNATGIIVAERDGKKHILADILGIVHVSVFFEDPLLFFPAFEGVEKPQNYIAFITELKHTDSLTALGIQNISYISPFIDIKQLTEPEKEKDIEIAFVGPVVDPQIIVNSVSQNYPQEIMPFFFETGEFMFRNPEVHVITAFNYVFGLFNPQMQEQFNKWKEQNPSAFMRFLNDITAYTTMRRRMYLLHFLDGMDVKIVGDYQGNLFENHEAVKVSSYEQLLKYYSRANLTVYVSPQTYPTGLSVIPLEILYMGSLPLIDFKGAIPSFIKPDEEILTFAPLDRADLEEKIVFYLEENRESINEIVQRGRKAVEERFTVKDRGEFVYSVLSDVQKQYEAAQKGQVN
ncbi:MAG: glycosyltransferase family 1 protein [Aquifex sp.]|nr:MAG: glycosyltransferase family 1 protein [Aquifex sp.]